MQDSHWHLRHTPTFSSSAYEWAKDQFLYHVGMRSASGTVSALEAAQVSPAALVIEVTEHDLVTDVARLVAVAD